MIELFNNEKPPFFFGIASTNDIEYNIFIEFIKIIETEELLSFFTSFFELELLSKKEERFEDGYIRYSFHITEEKKQAFLEAFQINVSTLTESISSINLN